MCALLGESKGLGVFRHSADPGADGCARFGLGDVHRGRIHPRDGYHIEIRVAADRVRFAIVLEARSLRGFLAVRRRRLDCHGYALCGFSVSACLAFGRRAGREGRFGEIQFPRADYRVRRNRRTRRDRKYGADKKSFEYGLHVFPRKWMWSARKVEVAFLICAANGAFISMRV